jgi:hypothetical protein
MTQTDLVLAKAYFNILVDLAGSAEDKTITYGELVREAKRRDPKNFIVQKAIPTTAGRRLDAMRSIANEVGVPDLSALVVNQRTRKNGRAYRIDGKEVREMIRRTNWGAAKLAFEDLSGKRSATAAKKSSVRIKQPRPMRQPLTVEYPDKHSEDLLLACRTAVQAWQGPEGDLSRELQSTKNITEDFLRSWLGYWMLARSNPRDYRADLAHFLTQSARPRIRSASDEELPALIEVLTVEMQRARATATLQTSLMSKFSFSLRPEIIVPYDRRARLSLSRMFGETLEDHDYLSYLSRFHRFADEVSQRLDQSGFTRNYKPDWMSEQLFKMRTADKYFMLQGGFSRERMARGLTGVG